MVSPKASVQSSRLRYRGLTPSRFVSLLPFRSFSLPLSFSWVLVTVFTCDHPSYQVTWPVYTDYMYLFVKWTMLFAAGRKQANVEKLETLKNVVSELSSSIFIHSFEIYECIFVRAFFSYTRYSRPALFFCCQSLIIGACSLVNKISSPKVLLWWNSTREYYLDGFGAHVEQSADSLITLPLARSLSLRLEFERLASNNVCFIALF